MRLVGHKEEMVCLVAGIGKVWGQKGTSELHLGKQGEKVCVRVGAWQEGCWRTKAGRTESLLRTLPASWKEKFRWEELESRETREGQLGV